jgi:hypothetical protein
VGAILLLALVWFIAQPTGVSSATIVVLPSQPGLVEVVLPLWIDTRNAQIINANQNPDRWWDVVLARYPVSSSTQSDVSVTRALLGPSSLLLRTNGTLVVGISWEPRGRSDVLPFVRQESRPGELIAQVSGPPARILIVSETSWYHFWAHKTETSYALTSLEPNLPSGAYPEGTHPVSLLIGAATPVPIVDGRIPLVWGAFEAEGTP